MRQPGEGQAWDMVMMLLRWHRHQPPDRDHPLPMCSCGLTAVACEILAAGRDSGLLPPLPQTWQSDDVSGSRT